MHENRLDRLQRVNMAAAKQCQRLHEMILNPPKNINGLLPLDINSSSFVSKSKLAFLADAEGTPLVGALTSSRMESSGLIVVGHEGGKYASRKCEGPDPFMHPVNGYEALKRSKGIDLTIISLIKWGFNEFLTDGLFESTHINVRDHK